MDNGFAEGTWDQYVTYPSGEALVRYLHMSCYNNNSKLKQRFDTRFGFTIYWKSKTFVILVCTIQYGGCDINKLVPSIDAHFFYGLSHYTVSKSGQKNVVYRF